MNLPLITPDTIELAPGDELILRFRTWEDYEELLSRRQDKAGLRIRYNRATQELKIMSPLPKHGNNADLLADLVKILLRYQGQDWQAYTPITLKRMGRQGIELDYCFYIQNRDLILGKERIDLEIDPPPDLVIEIDLTSTTQVEDYSAIAAPELWIYRQERLLVYQFDGQQYRKSSTSQYFSGIDINLIPRFIARGWKEGSSVALREFEDFLRKI